MPDSLHPTDAIHEAVDGRLDAEALDSLERHLATCPRCRRELEAVRWTKAQMASSAGAATLPADLDRRIQHALDEEDRVVPSRAEPAARAARRFPQWIGWAAAAAAAIALAVWVGNRLASPSPPHEAAATFRQFVAGDLALDVATDSPPVLEARLQEAALGFPVRVFDFGMMNYALAGGSVHRLAGRSSALFAYRGPDGQAIVCQMYEGTIGDLPPPAARRTNDGIEFLVYRDGDVTIVFWQEGTIVCVLAGNEEPEAVIKLAFAKAVRL